MNTRSALAEQGGAISIVYSWNQASGTWLRFAPGLPDYLNDLDNLTEGAPYWFIANSAVELGY